MILWKAVRVYVPRLYGSGDRSMLLMWHLRREHAWRVLLNRKEGAAVLVFYCIRKGGVDVIDDNLRDSYYCQGRIAAMEADATLLDRGVQNEHMIVTSDGKSMRDLDRVGCIREIAEKLKQILKDEA
jgi:hypothetical protein